MATENKEHLFRLSSLLKKLEKIHTLIYEKGFFYAKWAYIIYMFI